MPNGDKPYTQHTVSSWAKLGRPLNYCPRCHRFYVRFHSIRQCRSLQQTSTVAQSSTAHRELPSTRTGESTVHSQSPVDLDAREQRSSDTNPAEGSAAPGPTAAPESRREARAGPFRSTAARTRKRHGSLYSGFFARSMRSTNPGRPRDSASTQGQERPPAEGVYFIEKRSHQKRSREERSKKRSALWLVWQRQKSPSQQQREVKTGHGIFTWNQPRDRGLSSLWSSIRIIVSSWT